MTAAKTPDIMEVLSNLSNDEVFTPPWAANAILDQLPEHVWSDPSLRWLDPCVKTGVFLREVTKRLLTGLAQEFPDRQARLEHILRNMVFGIAITDLTAMLARRSLYCSKDAAGPMSVVKFPTSAGNIWYGNTQHTMVKTDRCIECGASAAKYNTDGSENHAYGFIHAAARTAITEEIGTMKFDVIVGNPPYQMSDGTGGKGSSAVPIYNKFVDAARELNPRYLSMIIPSRWMAGGKGLDGFRTSMLSDTRIRNLVDYPNSTEVFPSVDIQSGVCYFLWNRDNTGPCATVAVRNGIHSESSERNLAESDVLIRDNVSLEILRKIIQHGEESFASGVSSRKPFNLLADLNGNNEAQNETDLKLYRRGGVGWIARNEISQNTEWIDQWKVLVSKAYGERGDGPFLITGKPIVAKPGSVCTETFIITALVNNEDEGSSVASYMRTRFFRFLVSLRKIGQNAAKGVYESVPIQTWDREWTDADLFAKYGLTADEQAHISNLIREMV
jgi:site-specific DNA-methyltransferase (adenine-specific)